MRWRKTAEKPTCQGGLKQLKTDNDTHPIFGIPVPESRHPNSSMDLVVPFFPRTIPDQLITMINPPPFDSCTAPVASRQTRILHAPPNQVSLA
ncbi:hypothetical protein CSOJ01_05214 [Colletotrichum sojae]|uniref:Uncharacterized protein n=1 Tax=Colletotrichum sojae TaxID=2175907 RepID=A0A8H6MXZ5_9PEZI|nr:hypothetical protein CSOJ01_05214 [Colletotrichum sojae]